MIHWTYLTDELAIKLWLTLLAGLIAIIFMWKIIEKTTTPRKPEVAQLLSGVKIEADYICGLKNKEKKKCLR
jgi:hypothetical protein